ncbi:hypothetical protein IAU59_000250 [Kwoniella sp. CBS 9459]
MRPLKDPQLPRRVWNNDVIRDVIVAHLDRSDIAVLLRVCKSFWNALVPKLYHTFDPENRRYILGPGGKTKAAVRASERRSEAYLSAVRTINLTSYLRIEEADHWLEAFESFECATTLITIHETVTRTFINDRPYFTLDYHKDVTAAISARGLVWKRVASSFGESRGRRADDIEGVAICTTISLTTEIDQDSDQSTAMRWWDQVVRGWENDLEQNKEAKVSDVVAYNFPDNVSLLDTLRGFDEKGLLAVEVLVLTHFDSAAIQMINLCGSNIGIFDFTGSPFVSLELGGSHSRSPNMRPVSDARIQSRLSPPKIIRRL